MAKLFSSHIDYAHLQIARKKPLMVRSISILSKKELKWSIYGEGASFIEEFLNLEALSILGTEVDYLSFDCSKLEYLKRLELTSNDFGYWYYEGKKGLKIAKNILESPNLEYLDLEDNRLIYLVIPDGKLQKLRHLNFSWNAEDFIPPLEDEDSRKVHIKLGQLPNLTYLDIGGNHLKELPSIFHLQSLKKLMAACNLFTELPKELSQLNQLQTLKLTNNSFKEFPYIDLPQLQDLNLSSSEIWWIDDHIALLQNLKVLNLLKNKLENLPSAFFKLTALEELNLSHNQFTEIPSKIAKLKKLRHLNLSYNQLDSLPKKLLELPYLRSLDITDTNISAKDIALYRQEYPLVQILP